MTYEQLVTECKRLRVETERAEVQFFLFLVKVEKEHADVWREAGCADFDQFLKSNHLTKPERYRFFLRGLDSVGEKMALENGVPWTISAGMLMLTTPEAMPSFEARAAAFVASERAAPSEEAVRQWRAEVDTRAAPPVGITRATELMRLREENKKLRADLAAAQARIAELEGNAKLKKAG